MRKSQISILQDRQGCLVLVSKSSNNVRVVIENLLQRILKIIIIRINVNKKYSYVKQKSNIRTDQIHTTIGTQLDFDIFRLRYLFNPMYSNEILRHLVWFFNINVNLVYHTQNSKIVLTLGWGIFKKEA